MVVIMQNRECIRKVVMKRTSEELTFLNAQLVRFI